VDLGIHYHFGGLEKAAAAMRRGIFFSDRLDARSDIGDTCCVPVAAR